jgi:hypothetical protein
MERLEVLDTVAHWKDIRELRNAVNHEYADLIRNLPKPGSPYELVGL